MAAAGARFALQVPLLALVLLLFCLCRLFQQTKTHTQMGGPTVDTCSIASHPETREGGDCEVFDTTAGKPQQCQSFHVLSPSISLQE
jgi:hypothetical protein